MLANGILLGYNTDGGSSYTDLPGLMEVPELGMDFEKVDMSTLADPAKTYEFGKGDYGDQSYKFKYDNSSANTSYRILRGLMDSKTIAYFQETFPDGTKFRWRAMVGVKVGGGAFNGGITFTLSMAMQSAIATVDPDAALTVTAAKGTTATATKLTISRAANAGNILYVKCGTALTAPAVGSVIDVVTLNGYTQYVSASTDVACAAGNNAVAIEVRAADRMVVASGVCAAVVVGP